MTALGINNNGELIFPYGKEDTDYNIDGNPASGYVFNGATSVFWCRLRDLLPGEITTTFQTVTAECFSAEHLIKEFDEYQECYPEEIWRLDVQRKYIRTFTGESIDNSKPKKDPNYLRDMMQGRKKYQRRQWIRDQEIYFGTMNLMNTVVGDNNRIIFRCYTPTVDDIVVQPDYTLKITPYSDMYVSAMFGNGDTRQIRAKAGQQYELNFVPSTTDDTQVTIYGANRIQALNDLSACYLTTINISMADKLKKLVLGNSTTGYSNPRLTALSLGNNRLLEELDIRNCNNLTGSLNLSECNNLLKLYAEGTSLTGVIFSTNGKVQIAHLPDTVNTLTMRNLDHLTDFQASLMALETLTLQGGTLDSLEIVEDCIDTLKTLYLYDIDWTGNDSLADTTLLNQLCELFYSAITGTVHVPSINTSQLNAYQEAWKDLDITYDIFIPQHTVTFLNDDGTVLDIQYVNRGEKPVEPIASGRISTPVKASTVDKVYTFSGWDNTLDIPVTSDITIKATYTESVRQYTVNYIVENEIVQTSVVDAYGAASYEGDTPQKTGSETLLIWHLFSGWSAQAVNVTSDMDIVAQFDTCILPAIKTQEDLAQYDYLCSDNPNSTSAYTVQELYAICMSDRYKDYLAIGDRIEIYTADIDDTIMVDSSIVLQVYGFNHYRLSSDRSKFAPVVLGMVGLMNAIHQMNISSTNVGGWATSNMRQYLNETIYPALPIQWQTMIKTVDVLSSEGNTSATITTSEDKLFLFSRAEVGFSVTTVPYSKEVDADAESVTFGIFTSNASRIKKTYNGEGSAGNWWLRSPAASSSANFCYVLTGGDSHSTYASALSYVVFGFCMGG